MHISDKETIIQGTPGSPGIAFGPVHVVARGFSAPEVYEISTDKIETEQERFSVALEKPSRSSISCATTSVKFPEKRKEKFLMPT